MYVQRLGLLARSILEQPLFSLEPHQRSTLKCGRVDRKLQDDFASYDCPLLRPSRVTPLGGKKWVVHDEHDEYVVRDCRNNLTVARRKHPLISNLMTRAEHLAHVGPTRLRQFGACETAAFRKHVIEHPRQLMVNIGAGRWHARNWKVLEHQGVWYRYAPFFVDFDHDLVGGRPLPFADRSVHRFYSEHVFEHFSDRHCAAVFGELRRCLRDDGGLRVVVPDADLIWRKYGQHDKRFFARWMHTHNATLAEAFLILVGHPRAPFDADDLARRHATLPKPIFLDQCVAGLEYDPSRAGEHVNWFDHEKLARMLVEAGFGHVELASAQGSRFPEMRGPSFDKRAWYSLHVDAWP